MTTSPPAPQPSWTLPPLHLEKKDWVTASAVFVLALTLYAFTVLPDVIGIAPALVIYVLLRDRRVITLRLLLVILVILVIGVAQYGFIILRTSQAAPYLESSAMSVTELVGIVTAERFAEQRFAFSPADLFGYQIPTVSSFIGVDLTPLGVARW